jgi:plastocyanin
MKRLFILFILILSLVSVAYAADDNSDLSPELMLVNQAFDGLEGTKLPGPAQKFITNGDVNVYLTMLGSELTLGILIRNGLVETIGSDVSLDPVLDIHATQDFIARLDGSDNPLKVVKEGLSDGSFSYKAYGFFNKIKFKFLFTFMSVGSMFADGDDIDNPQKSDDFDDEDFNDNVKILDQEDEEMDEVDNNAGLLTGSIVSNEVAEVVEKEIFETHIVEFVDTGFYPIKITINAGDTVVWQNVREGVIKKSFLIGTQSLTKARSKILMPGDAYSWTFEKPGKFVFVDGIMTTQTMTVVVE